MLRAAVLYRAAVMHADELKAEGHNPVTGCEAELYSNGDDGDNGDTLRALAALVVVCATASRTEVRLVGHELDIYIAPPPKRSRALDLVVILTTNSR